MARLKDPSSSAATSYRQTSDVRPPQAAPTADLDVPKITIRVGPPLTPEGVELSMQVPPAEAGRAMAEMLRVAHEAQKNRILQSYVNER